MQWDTCGCHSGVDMLLSDFLGKSVVNQTQNALASNLLGMVNAVQNTPVISIPVPVVNTTQLQEAAKGAQDRAQGAVLTGFAFDRDTAAGNPWQCEVLRVEICGLLYL